MIFQPVGVLISVKQSVPVVISAPLVSFQRTLALPSRLLAMFQPGGRPVVALRDRQLFTLETGELVPWLRAAGRVRGLVRQGPEQYWLLTDNGQLYHIDGRVAARRRHPAESSLHGSNPYVMTPLPDGGYAVVRTAAGFHACRPRRAISAVPLRDVKSVARTNDRAAAFPDAADHLRRGRATAGAAP